MIILCSLFDEQQSTKAQSKKVKITCVKNYFYQSIFLGNLFVYLMDDSRTKTSNFLAQTPKTTHKTRDRVCATGGSLV